VFAAVVPNQDHVSSVADALAVLSCAANLPRSDELQAILKVAGQ
jgi:hypothetical protein